MNAPSPRLSQAARLPTLYHATNLANIEAIRAEGLQTRHYGAVHGEMDIPLPWPCLFLSRMPDSNNLPTGLFERGPVVVLTIDPVQLDHSMMAVDDAFYAAWGEEAILGSARSVATALGIPPMQARQVYHELSNASDQELPQVARPFWRWWLAHRLGGEVSYLADIAPQAILGMRLHPDSQPVPGEPRTPGL